ncbi:hypothetical protein TB1_037494 [Malus domestica]
MGIFKNQSERVPIAENGSLLFPIEKFTASFFVNLVYYLGVILVMDDVLLSEITGWVIWYHVGKFVKKDFYALQLFEELSKRPLYEKHPMAKFVWSVTNNTAIVEWYNACQEALLETLHLTTHATSELHIATSWQMLKSFWNALTITDYIMEIEFLWEKDIKGDLWGGNATCLIFFSF